MRREWRSLPENEQEALLAMAKAVYDDDAKWEALPDVAKKWAACHVESVLDDDDPLLPTYGCPKCLDRCYIVGRDNTAWFCTCRKACFIEAQMWFEQIYKPTRGKRRMRDNQEYAKFLSYLRQRENGVMLREAVNALVEAEERRPVGEES